MGNYKFRLSHMIPNSWFYKLKDNMRRSTTTTITTTRAPKRILHHQKPTTKDSSSIHPFTTQPSQQLYIPNRPSYYFPSNDPREKPSSSPAHPSASDTHFPIDLPKKSKTPTRRKPNNPSSKPISSVLKSVHLNNSPSSASTDITFDAQTQNPTMSFDDVLSQHRLPPILTKPAKKEAGKTAEVQNKHVMQRRARQGLRRIKVRHGSSKLELKRMAEASTNRLADSFVIVKRSADPMKEFRESMVEMIVENDLRATKDLEELLVCYLSLNSDEYHGLIVEVFEEILIILRDAEV